MVFDLFLLFYCNFFIVFACFYFFMFFCSCGSAEDKYLKVPKVRDDVEVEIKVQLALRYGICVKVLL